MHKLKSGKEEIVYLLGQVVDKFQLETGTQLNLNTNRKNYESLAIFLSDISNQFPSKSVDWQTDDYEVSRANPNLEFPYRKYDITGGQLKDALSGITSSPKNFLIDACYVYLFGVGRKGFAENPTDVNLLLPDESTEILSSTEMPDEVQPVFHPKKNNYKLIVSSLALATIAVIGAIYCFFKWHQANIELSELKRDMTILPYQPTAQEIDAIEGIWMCYTGSPQARQTYADRYHKVVINILDVKYKNGYFIYKRFGASFNHSGYMQFESPKIVSIYSNVTTKEGKIESPRHSLLNLGNLMDGYYPVISASWNFDVGKSDKIIGIREVYKKLGNKGKVEEVMNQLENASCQCKIVQWQQPDGKVEKFYLKNENLDSVPPQEIRSLIDGKSILLDIPDSTTIL